MDINIQGVEKELEYINDIQKQFEILERKNINIGVLDSESPKILMIAHVQEFGIQIKITDKMRRYLRMMGLFLKDSTTHINIPERSFIRRTVDEKENDILKFKNERIDKMIDGNMTAIEYLNELGKYMVELTKETLIKLDSPKNHPFTANQKGSSNPLIDTGKLLESISYEIV